MESRRSVGAVTARRVAVRVEAFVALLAVLLLLGSHDMRLHPRSKLRSEHVATVDTSRNPEPSVSDEATDVDTILALKRRK